MLLELVHRRVRRLVVHLEDLDEVGDGQHADKLLPLGVPEGCRPDAVVDERVKCLLDEQLGVEHDQLGRRRHQVIALVESEELDKDLRLVLF